MLVSVLLGVIVGVTDGVNEIVGVGVLLFGTIYSTCNRGAPDGRLSYALAVRTPVPVIIITRQLPADHPGRFTIS